MDQTSFPLDTDLGVMYKLGSIESQLKAINDKLDHKEAAQDKEIDNINRRLVKVEAWRNTILGATTAISIAIGFLIKLWPS